MAATVLIVGGGVGGMSAAHELASRGFSVTVLERSPKRPGGKARSFDYRGVPAEHGFRFFPQFYHHLDDTMARIPYRDNPRGVLDNLVSCEESIVATMDHPWSRSIVRLPRSTAEIRTWLSVSKNFRKLGITAADFRQLREKFLRVLTSCEQRRYTELENISWWDFLQASEFSHVFQMAFATAQVQNSVACKAQEISARTAGQVALRLLLNIHTPGQTADRVLNGPTYERWIGPWFRHLQQLGVDYRMGARVHQLEVAQGQRPRVRYVDNHGQTHQVAADYLILAVPVERAAQLVSQSMRVHLPSLQHLDRLSKQTRWMSGIQFYLERPLGLVRGHINCFDTPWALTAIPEEQMWPAVDLSARSKGRVRGILSVDISAFDKPGLVDGPSRGRCARDCLPETIAQEVWLQLQRCLNTRGPLLTDYLFYHLDDGLVVRGGKLRNRDPLFINERGSWALRPDVETAHPRFFVVGDWVRTHTDLATMEAANEAARRAVNGVLRHCAPQLERCQIWDHDAAMPLANFRSLDAVRFEQGRPWEHPLVTLRRPAATLRDMMRVHQSRGTCVGPRYRGTPSTRAFTSTSAALRASVDGLSQRAMQWLTQLGTGLAWSFDTTRPSDAAPRCGETVATAPPPSCVAPDRARQAR